MTAPDLLRHLTARGCTAFVVDNELAIEPAPPAKLDDLVEVLTMPLLSLLTGRRLIAIDEHGRGCVRADGTADPTALLPRNVRLLAVEGLTEWDRVSPYAAEAHPHLFAMPTTRKGAA